MVYIYTQENEDSLPVQDDLDHRSCVFVTPLGVIFKNKNNQQYSAQI